MDLSDSPLMIAYLTFLHDNQHVSAFTSAPSHQQWHQCDDTLSLSKYHAILHLDIA